MFVYTAQPARVVFGAGSLDRLAEEVERLGRSRVLVLAGARHRARVEAVLGERAVGTFEGAAMHTPVAVTEIGVETMGRVRRSFSCTRRSK